MEYYNYIIAFFAALAAGFVNAIAGGGTLITFPVLVALGIPPVAANITNTIALCPGYFGGTYAQRKDFLSQKKHLWFVIPSAIIGGICGGVLLLCTSENTFRIFIPYLILTATIILALQKILKNYISKQNQSQILIALNRQLITYITRPLTSRCPKLFITQLGDQFVETRNRMEMEPILSVVQHTQI